MHFDCYTVRSKVAVHPWAQNFIWMINNINGLLNLSCFLQIFAKGKIQISRVGTIVITQSQTQTQTKISLKMVSRGYILRRLEPELINYDDKQCENETQAEKLLKWTGFLDGSIKQNCLQSIIVLIFILLILKAKLIFK